MKESAAEACGGAGQSGPWQVLSWRRSTELQVAHSHCPSAGRAGDGCGEQVGRGEGGRSRGGRWLLNSGPCSPWTAAATQGADPPGFKETDVWIFT